MNSHFVRNALLEVLDNMSILSKHTLCKYCRLLISNWDVDMLVQKINYSYVTMIENYNYASLRHAGVLLYLPKDVRLEWIFTEDKSKNIIWK